MMRKTFGLMLLAAVVCVIAAGPVAAQTLPNPVVVIETTLGTMTAELYADKAPRSVSNFLQYVKSGFYTGTIFHRVIKTFMIQGGGFTPTMTRKPTRPPVPNESGNGLSNALGALAMARTNDPNSATAQFFINTKDNPRLDKERSPDGVGYAVFGKLVGGLDVLEKIASVPVTIKGSYENVPVTPVIIKSITLKK
jgi:peptidyl-prolyl cis-trans isomerase A (cyclophilin A)